MNRSRSGQNGALGSNRRCFFEQNRRDIRHAHWHAGVAGIRGCDCVKRQRADGGGAHPVLGVGGAEGLDVQRRDPFLGVFVVGGHIRAAFKIKRALALV